MRGRLKKPNGRREHLGVRGERRRIGGRVLQVHPLARGAELRRPEGQWPNGPDGSARTIESPAFQSALHSCQRLLPKGPPGPEPPSGQTQARMLTVSACMRKHGISGFPDPSTSPPSNPTGNSGVIGSGGYYLAIPKSIDTNAPAFHQAAAACNFGPGR